MKRYDFLRYWCDSVCPGFENAWSSKLKIYGQKWNRNSQSAKLNDRNRKVSFRSSIWIVNYGTIICHSQTRLGNKGLRRAQSTSCGIADVSNEQLAVHEREVGRGSERWEILRRAWENLRRQLSRRGGRFIPSFADGENGGGNCDKWNR